MPPNHAYYVSWSPERITGWATKVGPFVEKMIIQILKTKKHPEQAYRICLGIIGLEKKYGPPRVNQACARALGYGLYSYKSVKNILEKGLDSLVEENYQEMQLPVHANIRGPQYYN
jgi:transposase